MGDKISKTFKHGTDLWETSANLKGLLSNIGHQCCSYEGFKHFFSHEIMAFTGLIMLNGLGPSMQFEFQFKIQEEDPVAGIDFCAKIFGENAERR